jgi:hypothetical protein
VDNEPLIELLYKSNSRILLKLLKLEGIVPVRRLDYNCKNSKIGKFEIVSEILPENLLLKR